VSHHVGVIADSSVSLGFRLAGLSPREVESPTAAARALDDMIAEGRWGVILVQEDLMPELTPPALRRSATGLPVLVPFPGPSRERLAGEAEAYVAELLRLAVGYTVRLR
jgi:vacuolar-type H+-ATPase subunit F/Vma7